MEYKIYSFNNYRIHTIKTDKFKNCSMEVMFTKKLQKEEITINNVLTDILVASTKNYKSRRDIAIEFENLYNSYTRGLVTRLGNYLITSFVTDFLDPKYCDEDYLDELFKFSFGFLTEPNIENGEFDKRSFTIVTNRLKAEIQSVKENATKYAFKRALNNMDENSPSSYYMTGYLEDLEDITTSNLVDYYNKFFKECICDIYVIGNLDMDEIVSYIKKYFNVKTKKNGKKTLFVENVLRTDKLDILETGKYEQATFIMLYNLVDLSKRERDIVIHLFNFIFGNGGLTSKLYRYLREENSLCYNTSSMYQKYDQLLMIYAGVDSESKDLCVELVNKALKEMQEGNFSLEDIENAKKNLISSIKMSQDTLGGIVNNYLFNDLDNLPLYEERIKEFKKVTKEEIVALAKKIKLNLTYLLAEEEVQDGRN